MSNQYGVGIEYNSGSIRAVRVSSTPAKGGNRYELLGTRELLGDFTKRKNCVDALKELSTSLGISHSDSVVGSLSGKQVHVAQLPFKKIPVNEMRNALRYEIRQSLPFDSLGAYIDYQWTVEPQGNTEGELIAAVVGNKFFDFLVDCFKDSGIHLDILDVLPLALSNTLWLRHLTMDEGIAQVCLNVSEEACNLVVDGCGVGFYSRTIPFKFQHYLAERNGNGNGNGNGEDYEKQNALKGFSDELRRSLSYYEKNHGLKGFGRLSLSGRFCENDDLLTLLQKELGLPFAGIQMKDLLTGQAKTSGLEYEVALTLAMRGTGK